MPMNFLFMTQTCNLDNEKRKKLFVNEEKKFYSFCWIGYGSGVMICEELIKGLYTLDIFVHNIAIKR